MAFKRKGPVAENVISAREMTLSGLDAMQRGKWEQAENHFGRAIEACPTDERTHHHYAEALWQRGAVQPALDHMEKAVKLSGGDALLLVKLGEMYLNVGELNKAYDAAERAIQGDHQLATAWALRGDVLFEQQQLSQALASYHRALSYQKSYPKVQLAAARIYHQLDRPRRTLTTVEALQNQYRSGTEPQDLLVLHGLALKKLGQYSEAVNSLAAATKRDRPTSEILYYLAEAQMLAGDHANARLSLTAALDINPRHLASRQLLERVDRQQPRVGSQPSLTAAVAN